MSASPFPENPAARLQVSAGSPLAEVFVVDHAFVLQARAVGYLDTKLEPGVYNVSARLGDQTADELVVLKDSQEVSMQLSLASPAPIEGTTRTHERHMTIAADESARITADVGSGASVFIMSRRWSREPERFGASRSPTVLSLHRLTGEPIVALDAPSSRNSDPAAGMTVAVDPGAYLLRWQDESGFTAEQIVQAVADWQIQIFLLDDDDDSTASGRQAMSVLMSKKAFDPSDYMSGLTEEARVALMHERRVAAQVLDETLSNKFDNPMLGLFGAHLMLLAKSPVETEDRLPPDHFDESLFAHVVDNLRGLLGVEHPDVVALATQLGDRPDHPLTAPPMLWRSWALLIEASNKWPEILPVDVWRRTIGLLPVRPFLVWSPQEDDAEQVQQWHSQVAAALRRSRPPVVRAIGGGQRRGRIGEETRRRFSMQLLAPRAAIDEAAGSDVT